MGEPLPPRRLQVCGGGLTAPAPIARVVPDVTGLDRAFDYRVPEGIADRATIGSVVRVPLHGRKVKGWIVARSDDPVTSVVASGDPFRTGDLQEIIDVRGVGVAGNLITLTTWCAERWSGPLRSVLVAASAPRLRDLAGSAQYSLVGSRRSGQDRSPGSTADDVRDLRLHVAAPHRPVISLALDATSHGPVLLLCPTLELARRGAAWLRRQGAVVAEYPQDWSRAAGGVDVVVGSRSTVWAPVPNLGTVVVIDEHDTSYINERAPHWDATRVAVQRASESGARVILSSPTPSLARMEDLADGAISLHEDSDRSGWGRIEIVDLNDERQNGGVPSTLISTSLLDVCRDETRRIGIVLNSSDEAAIVVCSDCAARASCSECSSPVAGQAGSSLVCPRCRAERAAICGSCGSTKLRAPRLGFKALAASLRKAVRRDVAIVSAAEQQIPSGAGVFVGTEALLHRVHPLDVVVVADADAWLGSPRLGAVERLWALAARSVRAGGGSGVLLVQSRLTDHPALRALSATGDRGFDAYRDWASRELASRRELKLPPLVPSALVNPRSGSGVRASDDPAAADAVRDIVARVAPSVRRAVTPDGVLLLADDRQVLRSCLEEIRKSMPRSRIVVDPREM